MRHIVLVLALAVILLGCQTGGNGRISAVPEEAFLPPEDRDKADHQVVRLEDGWMRLVYDDDSSSFVRVCPELSPDGPRSRR